MEVVCDWLRQMIGLPPVKIDEMQEIAGDLTKMLEICCEGIVRTPVLDERLPVFDIGRILQS